MLAIALTACGSASDDAVGGDAAGPSGHRQERPGAAQRQGSVGSFERAIEVRQKSGCRQAIPRFEALAKLGSGYEVAELQLGECYLEVAGKTASAEQAQDLRAKAADWIVKAANGDLPEAQERAAKLYFAGTGVAADAIEAGKWFLLLQRNPLRSVLGPAEIDAGLAANLQQRLSETDWQDARRLADQWQPTGRETKPPQSG